MTKSLISVNKALPPCLKDNEHDTGAKRNDENCKDGDLSLGTRQQLNEARQSDQRKQQQSEQAEKAVDRDRFDGLNLFGLCHGGCLLDGWHLGSRQLNHAAGGRSRSRKRLSGGCHQRRGDRNTR